MTDSIDSNHEVKAWLLSMTGKMIRVLILQKSEAGKSEQMLWKGQGKVVRCVNEGVVLDLNAGTSWWSKILRPWNVTHVAPRWIPEPLSVPYHDLSINQDPTTGRKQLVIDAATWKRSPEDLTQKSNVVGE